MSHETPAFALTSFVPIFPRTRYQGSKRRLTKVILDHLRGLSFTTVLDAFGGTAAMAHAFKRRGCQVTYNDVLSFNHQIGIALIENDGVQLGNKEIAAIGEHHPGIPYGNVIEEYFEGIYFTPEENRWLDLAIGNIRAMPCRFKRAMAWFALFQAAMAKRPYNLFHRRNLYMRMADVQRSFGNKASWDRPFPEHVTTFAAEANRAVFDGGAKCRAICMDALAIEPNFDLVYIDPPYINRRGVGVDYRDFYHFLEGILHYEEWPAMIDRSSKHRRLDRVANPWTDRQACAGQFTQLFDRFRESTLVVSYRDDGIPTIPQLVEMMKKVKGRVNVIADGRHQYALSTTQTTHQVLLIGTDG